MAPIADPLAPRPGRIRLAVFASTLAAYATSLHGPFQFDDFGVIVRYPPVHSLGAWWAALGHGLRPLLKLTYAANWQLGLGPFGFHVINLLLHVFNIELVMRVYTAARHPEQRWPFSGFDTGSAIAGVLFAVHPLQTEAVTYISGRSSSLATLFVLFSLLAYVAGVRARRAWLWLGVAPLAFVCAVASKESAAALPALLLLWELCIERTRPRVLLARQLPWWIVLGLLLAVAIMDRSYFALLYQITGYRPAHEALWYQIAGAGYLASRLLLVHRLSIDPGLGLHPPALAPAIASAVLLAGMLALAFGNLRKRPPLALGLLWFLLFTFVPYVILPRPEVLNERHMYLAGIGLWIAIAAACSGVLADGRLGPRTRVSAAVLVVLLVVRTAQRNLDYASANALWQSTARISPDNPRAHNNLGLTYEALGRTAEARAAYAKAVELEPTYESARKNMERVAE